MSEKINSYREIRWKLKSKSSIYLYLHHVIFDQVRTLQTNFLYFNTFHSQGVIKVIIKTIQLLEHIIS